MVRAVPLILVGAALGSVATWSVSGRATPGAPPPGLVATERACDADEVSRLKQRMVQLESELSRPISATGTRPPGAAVIPSYEEHDDPAPSPANDALSWKISAIEKFVPLAPEQKERLRERYERESDAQAHGTEVEVESLEEILGPENASYYRAQVQAAFKRVQDEEIERESVWLSRKLGLSQEQETSMRQVFERVEAELGTTGHTSNSAKNPQERVRAMIAENRRRSELRIAELSRILTPEQLQVYARLEAESSASDVEVFHDPGAGQGAAAPK